MRIYNKRHIDTAKVVFVAAIIMVLVAALTILVVRTTADANAARNRAGAPQVTLNSGGGLLSDGSDGLRFTVNTDTNYSSDEEYDEANEGQDGVVYRGTYQYCCSGGAPMLNIGGELYGQAGPASSSENWSTIQVISTSGAATTGARNTTTGDSSVTIRYTVERGGMTYVVDRTISYYYPNDFVTDRYSFTIPEENGANVKFYLGGDTAPGSDDQGYGIMLTEPVRTIISLNTNSQIMYGFREIQGSRPFDGATSQHYNAPYGTVQEGGDIGFVETASNHDAGLMMQWNLGSTPGTYTGSLEQFATLQSTNLNATLAESYSEVEGVVDLNISIVNSELYQVSGLGYTITLPQHLLIEAVATSTCGGTLTAAPGTGVITLTGVTVAAATNCVVSLPVSSVVAGSYTVNRDSVSNLTGVLTNNVGVSTLNVGVYSLSFATQGGASIPTVTREEGTTVTIPNATRAGYTFLGWNTLPNGTGTAYAAGSTYTVPSNNSTLYARWQYIPYTLTFNTQGGSAVDGLSDLATGTDVELEVNTERDGYEFVEWNTLANGTGIGYESGDRYPIPAGNSTLYAIWSHEVTLTFDGQDGEFFEEYTEYSGNYFTTADAPTRTGYTFVEWNTSADGTGTSYVESEEIPVPSENVTYYAIWEDNDGVSREIENTAPNNGDGNNDGILDSQQANVTSFTSPITGKPVTLAVSSEEAPCLLSDVSLISGSDLPNDAAYAYPVGLFDFSVACGDPGFTANVTQYFYDAPSSEFVMRKLANEQYTTITDTSFGSTVIGGRDVLAVSYDVTDGGALDADGEENGVVVDPAGPAVSNAVSAIPDVPNTGLQAASIGVTIGAAVVGIVAIITTVLQVRRKTHASRD